MDVLFPEDRCKDNHPQYAETWCQVVRFDFTVSWHCSDTSCLFFSLCKPIILQKNIDNSERSPSQCYRSTKRHCGGETMAKRYDRITQKSLSAVHLQQGRIYTDEDTAPPPFTYPQNVPLATPQQSITHYKRS